MPTSVEGRRSAKPGAATSHGSRILIVAAVIGFGVLHLVAGEMMHAAAAPIAHAVASAYGD